MSNQEQAIPLRGAKTSKSAITMVLGVVMATPREHLETAAQRLPSSPLSSVLSCIKSL